MSIEGLIVFMRRLTPPVMCLTSVFLHYVHLLVTRQIIQRPPQYNKDVIGEFSEFLSALAPRSDRLLILGDSSIHIRCKTQRLLDSFNSTQLVSGSTRKDHTLDLVFTSGFHVSDVEVLESGSDRSFVLCHILPLPGETPARTRCSKPHPTVKHRLNGGSKLTTAARKLHL
ncbi:Vesicular-fusion protein SEC18 [Labeo rohita]|uniref:Vesicular-fusion protein SEC18 n=1 Tax=Labeo rohita TaxID=84645 RepID=A0ABQ8L3D2_LABRO|nr:Vesicular-fusion protein SEC18 [Labeo rohita]